MNNQVGDKDHGLWFLNSILVKENGFIGYIKEDEVSIDVANGTSEALPDDAMPGRTKGSVHVGLDACINSGLRLAISSCIEN